jgi:hypothetical protein
VRSLLHAARAAIESRRRDARELAPLSLDALRGCEQPPRQAVQALRARLDRAPQVARQAPAQALHVAEGLAVGARQRRGRGRRWRAHVGDEIGDGEVGLVADAAHDRERAGERSPAPRPPR